jgi:ribose transport system substrate-binding protein
MKRSVQRALVPALTLGFALTLSCSSPAPEKPAKTTKTVVFISNSASDFWKVVRRGAEKADTELNGVRVLFKMPFGGTWKEQDRLVMEALTRDGADAIAISPIDPASQKKSINNAAKKALLITQDSDAPDTDRVLYLGADNRDAGRQAGALMKKALPQGGKVMVFVGKREVQNAQDRLAGLKESLQGSKVEILDLMIDDNDHVRAKDNAAETLTKHPDVAGMIGLWSYNGPAILQAVKNSNKVGKVKIVCFDDEEDTLNGIKEGAIFGTVAQQPFEYGYRGVQTLVKILGGDRSMIPGDKQVLIPTVIVERANLEDYRNKLSQMLAAK